MHIPNNQRYAFPRLPTHLDRQNRVDDWYMRTLEVLGIWPSRPDFAGQHITPPQVCNMHGCRIPCNCKGDRKKCLKCQKCFSYCTTPKEERFFFFICNNHKCRIDTFIARERSLQLVAVNPANFNDKMYSTKCKCGLTLVSTQAVEPECIKDVPLVPGGHCAPRFRRERNKLTQECFCPKCNPPIDPDDDDPHDHLCYWHPIEEDKL